MLDAELALERFLVSKRAAGRSPRTVAWYRLMLAHYLAYAAECALPPEEAGTIEAFLASRWDDAINPNTIHAYYRALRAWFRWAHQRSFLPTNPMVGIAAPHVPDDPVEHVELDEFRRLYNAVCGNGWLDQRDRVALLLLYWSGVRVSELVNLRRDDVDVRQGQITVRRGKGGRSRVVPAHPELPQMLFQYLTSLPPVTDDWLFWSHDGYAGVRGHLTPNGVRQMLKRRCKQANVRYMHPHLFRHGFAMVLLNNGMEIKMLGKAMGHRSTKTTERYADYVTPTIRAEYHNVLRKIDG